MAERGETGSIILNPMEDYAFYMNSLMTDVPRRRRRERKLLKIDELNERFPVVKYKEWSAERELAGLNPNGGISEEVAAVVPDGIVTNVMVSARMSIDDSQPTDDDSTEEPQHSGQGNSESAGEHINEKLNHVITMREQSPSPVPSIKPESAPPHSLPTSRPQSRITSRLPSRAPSGVGTRVPSRVGTPATDQRDGDGEADEPDDTRDHSVSGNASDNDDGLHETLVPPELAESSGGICAICIDALEPDNDVRALACHHVFHDECITPWLTTRKASCPLCKMDFYIPRRVETLPHNSPVQEPPLVFFVNRHRNANNGTSQDSGNSRGLRRFFAFRRNREPDVEMQPAPVEPARAETMNSGSASTDDEMAHSPPLASDFGGETDLDTQHNDSQGSQLSVDQQPTIVIR
jgi:hypothetical protein